MERMEYDPEGGNYQPITEHETGATFMVVGVDHAGGSARLDAICRLGHEGRRHADADPLRR